MMKKSPKDILYDLQHENSERSFETFFSKYHNHVLLQANSMVKAPDIARDTLSRTFYSISGHKKPGTAKPVPGYI
ncbi:hypothetical protein [Sinomicrobium weinanense]|uniref:Uncharacterized protein n=1 Tax=Sinomicrobium weinanense TaxID=2842200 RepID=A0A926Q1G2_9FLAO|nr:hypothetical protein [Sinomicrobium weinanense]MBC9795608.1 hypothetical protein [Sinomicrobium weinanense]MBU3124629.1 hypothetical protein [Sinomicrobium weinanense]